MPKRQSCHAAALHHSRSVVLMESLPCRAITGTKAHDAGARNSRHWQPGNPSADKDGNPDINSNGSSLRTSQRAYRNVFDWRLRRSCSDRLCVNVAERTNPEPGPVVTTPVRSLSTNLLLETSISEIPNTERTVPSMTTTPSTGAMFGARPRITPARLLPPTLSQSETLHMKAVALLERLSLFNASRSWIAHQDRLDGLYEAAKAACDNKRMALVGLRRKQHESSRPTHLLSLTEDHMLRRALCVFVRELSYILKKTGASECVQHNALRTLYSDMQVVLHWHFYHSAESEKTFYSSQGNHSRLK